MTETGANESLELRLSLVLATVGRTDEAARFLASLDRQGVGDIELVVVDQNEDDRLVPLLAPYRDRFTVRHLRSAPGLSRARNVGLR
ncbi:MAG: glycosyltransferase family A protein, partial [Burkholderiales bacterium]